MSIGRNTTYNLLGQGIPIILALVTVPLYLKSIGPDRYGVLSIAWLILGYFGMFDLGLGRATGQRIAALVDATPRERADAFWAAIAVNLLMGLIGAAILWPVAAYFFGTQFNLDAGLRAEVLQSVPLLALSVPVATSVGVLGYALIGRERFLQVNTVTITSTSLLQVLPLLVALFWTHDLRILLAAAVLARVITLAMVWWQCRREGIAREPFHFNWVEARQLLGFGGWVTVSSFFGPILFMLDRFAIGAIMNARAVTLYTVPNQIAQRITIIPVALNNALFPKLSAASQEDRLRMSARATAMIAAVVTPLTIIGIVAMKPFLLLWVGSDIGGEAWPLGCLILIAYWFNSFAQVPFTELQARGRPDLVSKTLIAEIPFYCVALFAGLYGAGLIGAALAFIFRNILDQALLTFVAFRKPLRLGTIAYALALILAATALMLWHADPLGYALCALLFLLSLVLLPLELATLDVPPRVRKLLAIPVIARPLNAATAIAARFSRPGVPGSGTEGL